MTNYYINHPNNVIPVSLTTDILKESDSFTYHTSLPDYAPTPLLRLDNLAKNYGVSNIYVKNEAFRLGLNAFKGLGVSFAVKKLLEANPDVEIFCTATDGNHGRAVAWAASLYAKKSIIFVPENTTSNRIKAIENEGGIVVQVRGNYDKTCAFAHQRSTDEGWVLIQDTAWENYEIIPALIMAGYITHCKELEATLNILPDPGIDIVFLQAGVGSWAASVIWYYLNRYKANRPKIVLIEPLESAGILASFKENKRVVPSGNYQTIMAGLNCGIPSLSAWNILKNGVDFSIRIKDEYAEQAMKEFYYPNNYDDRIISGESGAAGFAGFLAIMNDPEFLPIKESLKITNRTKILFFNTEGATDFDSFNKIVAIDSADNVEVVNLTPAF